MSYQEDEKVRLRRQGTKDAIALAMEGKWQEAVAVNRNLIENFPDDVDAHNRLGRAYLELGDYARAREAYGRAIALDPYNAIARKNLERLAHLKEAETEGGVVHTVEPQQFIEETGKAGVVSLVNLAPAEALARMVAGDNVNLRVDGASLIVEDISGEYLGQVEPRHSHRLVRLMSGGNRYTAAVVSSTASAVTVIIREVYQDPSQEGLVSFPARIVERARPYISDRVLRREIDYGEEEEETPGYTIVGEEEEEASAEEPLDEKGATEG